MKISLSKNIPRTSTQQSPSNPQCTFFNFNLQPIKVNYKKRSLTRTDRFMVGTVIPERSNRSRSGIKLTKAMPEMSSKTVISHQALDSIKKVVDKQKSHYKELSPKKIKNKVQNSSDGHIYTQLNNQKFHGSWKIPKLSVQQKPVKQKTRIVTQPQYISQITSKIMKADTNCQPYSYRLYGQEYMFNDYSNKNSYNYYQCNDHKKQLISNNLTEINYDRNRMNYQSKVWNNKNSYNMKINRNIINQPNSHNMNKDLQSNTIPVINVNVDLINNNHKDEIKQIPVPIPNTNQMTKNSKIKQENIGSTNIPESTQNGKLSKYMNSTETSKNQDNIWTSVNILNNAHENQKKIQSSRLPSYYRSMISSRSQSSNIKIAPQQPKNTYLQRPIKDLEQARQVNTVISGDIEASQHDFSRSYSRNMFLKELDCQMNQSIKILGHSTVVAKTSNTYQQGFWK